MINHNMKGINSAVKTLLMTVLVTEIIKATEAVVKISNVGLWLKSDTGLCAIGKTNITIKMKPISKFRCAAKCALLGSCNIFNYKSSDNICELFPSPPTCYLSLASCSIYQLKNSSSKQTLVAAAAGGNAADNCSFPFTYKGILYYSCMQNASNVCDRKCLVGNKNLQTCAKNVDYIVTNQTINLTIPTFNVSTAVISVNNWIVIQQRIDGSVSFNRKWAEYKAGFGNISTNFWLGLEKMYQMTLKTTVKLRIEIQATANKQWFSAEYATFRIDSESKGYAVYVTGYSGDAGDGFNQGFLTTQNGMKFTTVDVNNDNSFSDNCAKSNGGAGFWMNNCCYFDLNQEYNSEWFYWHLLTDRKLSPTMQLSGSRMMIKQI